MNKLNYDYLETKIFYRFIKVSHVFFMAILSLVPILISAESFFEHNWINALMILFIGFSASYSIPTLIKCSLLYIVYGVEIVYWNKFVATTSLTRRHTVQIFSKYPKVIYFSGICIFYALAFLIDDSFFTLVGFWILTYPLIKLIFLCKRAFVDKDHDAQDKLREILGYAILVCVLALCKGVYIIWTDPKLHYMFDVMLKYVEYVGGFLGICYWIYMLWLVKKSLINKDRQALKDLFFGLIGVAVWTIISTLYQIIKSKHFQFHVWHIKPLIHLWHIKSLISYFS